MSTIHISSRRSVALWSVLLLLALAPVAAYAGDQAAPSTAQNLLAAFEGESNASARYTAFAIVADKEGFKGAASLFRAAAKAEAIHAAAHKTVIEAQGGKAVAEIMDAEVKSTKENLEAAMNGEIYERDTMYPEFIALARKEGNKDALRSFNQAKTAEGEHAKLYKEAMDGLDSWKDTRTFYVCEVCGYTTTNLDFKKCVSCFADRKSVV